MTTSARGLDVADALDVTRVTASGLQNVTYHRTRTRTRDLWPLLHDLNVRFAVNEQRRYADVLLRAEGPDADALLDIERWIVGVPGPSQAPVRASA